MSRVARPSGLRPATDREYWRNPPMCTTRNVVSVALLALALGCTGCDCACRITKLDPDRKDAAGSDQDRPHDELGQGLPHGDRGGRG